MTKRKIAKISFLVLITLTLGSCSPKWSITVDTKEKEFVLNNATIDEFQYLKKYGEICEGIPLEIALFQNDIYVINSIKVQDSNGKKYSYFWIDIADTSCITARGDLLIGNEKINPELIAIEPNQYNGLKESLIDIFPTVMNTLNIKVDNTIYTQPLVDHSGDHVVLIFLDGMNFALFNSAFENGWLTVYENPDYYAPALSVYPPRTSVASAAIITGQDPSHNGVYKTGIRKTIEKTMFEIASENGYSAVSIEGESLPFNLRGSEVILSGDRDLNGSTDDNVFANAISVIEDELPNLFYIHFHGVDDLGHSTGPNSEEVMEKTKEIYGYINEIFNRLPENTMVITFADHGMHAIEGENGQGNHGNLIEEDMVVFINILIK